jgi:hypothetical protein
MRRNSFSWTILLAIGCLLPWYHMTLLAQTGNGVIRGTVFDQNHAVVPGADVTIISSNTNIAKKAQSNEVGIFYFGAVQPGPYAVDVEMKGFKKWASKVVLQVGQTEILEVGLEVGNLESVVEVAAVAPLLTTESAEVADVKDAQRIQQLPLNGRLISGLFNLTPGVEGGDSGTNPGANPRVNGLKVGSAEMLIDGMSLVDRFGGGMSRVQPGMDTIQEFRIETVGSSAQYSRPATISFLTKSGTNALHGSVFETHRNNAGGLRARARQDGNTSAKLIRNEFGASAGGPVYLGKLYDGRDKTFWFFSYEGLRQRQSLFSNDNGEYNVPTAAMWNGDFSGLVNQDGQQITIYDPLTTDANGVRQPFPNNIIPQNRLSPFYKTVQSLTDKPTNDTSPFVGPNHLLYYPNNQDSNNYTIKGDHRFSDKDNVSVRFTKAHQLSAIYGGYYGSPTLTANSFGTSSRDYPFYNASVQYNHVFTPTFLNELLVAGHYAPTHYGTLADFTDWAGNLGLPNPFGANGWPTFYTYEASYNGYLGWDADNLNDQHLTGFNVEDNVTKIKGKHSLKFGGKFRTEYNNIRELQQAQGSHTFAQDWTSLYDPSSDWMVPYTGSGLAAMALGLPTYLSNQYNRGYFYFQQKEIGLYFTDNWKVTPKLTLDLGLRWDKWTPYHEKYNRLVNVDVDNFANSFQVITPGDTTMESIPGIPPAVLESWSARGLSWTTANKAGFPSALFNSDNNNFAPRIGAAYRLSDKMVLRGSYGEYYWTMPLSQILQSSRSNPPLNLRFENNINTDAATGSGTLAMRIVPRENDYIGKAQVDTEGIVAISSSARYMVPLDGRHWKDSRAQSWHLTFERELMKNTALKFSYVGDHGSNLEQRYSLNAREAAYNYVSRTQERTPSNLDAMRVNPDWNFLATNRTGFSNTNSFQAEVERKFSDGLAYQIFYVYTRALSTNDAGGFTSGAYFGAFNATNGMGEVPENTNIMGSPNLTYDQRLRLLYYNSTNIPAQRIRWNGIYQLPFGRGKKFGSNMSKGLDLLLGGWETSFIGDWRSGTWQSLDPSLWMKGDPTLTADQRVEMDIFGRHQRLWFRGYFDPTQATNVTGGDLNALVPVNPADRIAAPLGPRFNGQLPMPLKDGSTFWVGTSDLVNPNARAFYRGPGSWNSDISIGKNFKVTEQVKFRFAADFFNAFNHPNDVNPNARTGLQDLSMQTNQPRIIQFSLRLDF